MSIFKKLSSKYRRRKKYEKEFRKTNPKSILIPKDRIPLSLIKCGKYSYGNPKIVKFNIENEKLEIGNYVSIADNVTFILSGNHYIDTFTTYPFKVNCFSEKVEAWGKGPIKVGDDVWIGYGATILSGVTIGQGAVIAAGSVVVKDVEPYSVVGGNPAKLLKYRYPKEIIEEMKKIDFSKIEPDDLKDIQDLIYKKLDMNVLNEIKKHLETKI
ncbi:MAG: CatB-related O-acetyltransferase [Fusobacterium sp.]|nr:CatB-related O-acetyltransferase [Fusobacterium sp.]